MRLNLVKLPILLNSVCTLNEISIKVQKYFEGSLTKFSKMSLEEIPVRMF